MNTGNPPQPQYPGYAQGDTTQFPPQYPQQNYPSQPYPPCPRRCPTVSTGSILPPGTAGTAATTTTEHKRGDSWSWVADPTRVSDATLHFVHWSHPPLLLLDLVLRKSAHRMNCVHRSM